MMTPSAEHLLEIQITQPGRVTGTYLPADADTLRLERVIYPEHALPFDVGILPTSLTPMDEPLTVILLGDLSHPAGTQLEARLLGALERAGDEALLLLAVPTADERRSHLALDSLPAEQRSQVLKTVRSARPGDWRWVGVSEIEPVLHAAVLRYRQAVQADRPIPPPAWKTTHIRPLDPNFLEADRYTAAEYTFHELPDHFQAYVTQILAPDERVLYAILRPALVSEKRMAWFRRPRLQAGVVILTNQRLIHLNELIPPDAANIRYGFHSRVGALNRLAGISLQPLRRNTILHTAWKARGGQTAIHWEMPSQTGKALEELSVLLRPFLGGRTEEARLSQATPPELPEKLPALRDPTVDDARSNEALTRTMRRRLDEVLSAGEQAYAWALLPAWHERRDEPRALVVSLQRLFLLPDLSLNIPLAEIATLEFTSSIIESFLAINHIRGGREQRTVITFPYPCQEAFRDCFEIARRCLAVVPPV